MAKIAEQVLWGQVCDVRDDADSIDVSRSRRLPFGVLKRLDRSWTARGWSETGRTRYLLDVAEHEPKNRIAAIVEGGPSMIAHLVKYTPPEEERGSVMTKWTVELTPEGVAEASGTIFGMNVSMDGQYMEPTVPVPLGMEDAAATFKAAMADARFGFGPSGSPAVQNQ